MGRYKKPFLWLIAILVIFTLVGFFLLPPIVKSVLTDKMSQALERPVSIREIKINPYLLTVKIQGFAIGERSRPDTFMSLDELFVNLDGSSLFRRALILKEIRLVKPYIRIVRNTDASYNFSDLLKKFGGPKPPEEKKTEPFHFSLNNIRVAGGGLEFDDGPMHTNHKVTDLLITIPFISNTAHRTDQFTQPVIAAKINGTPYAFHGKTKPFAESLETVLMVDVTDLNIPYYMAYVPVELNFRLISALLDAKVQLSYTQHHDKKPTLKISGDLALKDLAIDEKKGQPLIRLPRLDVTMAAVEPLVSNLHFSKIILTSPDVTVHRGPRGDLIFWRLCP